MEYKSRVLIVDDDIALLRQLEQILLPEYEVSLAASGAQALAFLKSGQWVDLILLDIMMPELDGHATLQEIRSLPGWERVPVIFLTSLSGPEAEAEGLRYGTDYITKPYSPITLLGRVDRALRTVGCLDRKKLAQLPKPLSEAEFQAAQLLVQGRTNEEIAGRMHYTIGSTKNLLIRVQNKLALESRKEIERYRKLT